MLYGIGLSGTGAQIERSKLENLSNNLANLDTPGFKADLLSVMQRPAESRTWFEPEELDRALWANDLQDRIGGGVMLNKTTTDFTPGPPIQTGNDYDFALTGPGFFTMQETHSGKLYYSRAGRFDVNPSEGGLLQTPDGKYTVLDRAGKPIKMTQLIESNGGKRAMVGDHGEIMVQVGSTTVNTGQSIGVAVFKPEELERLVKHGDNMYDISTFADEGEVKPVQLQDLKAGDIRQLPHHIKQGAFEGSGSDPIQLMSQMILVTRAYEANMKSIMEQDSTVSRLISGVGRVG
jgi:flagellar basal-body rod protein FlgF